MLGRVTRLTTRQVDIRILQVGEDVCGDEWAGVVRREDIRATEQEKVVVGEGFRVGDIIRAVVVSYLICELFKNGLVRLGNRFICYMVIWLQDLVEWRRGEEVGVEIKALASMANTLDFID